MKKLIALLLAVCLIGVAVVGYVTMNKEKQAETPVESIVEPVPADPTAGEPAQQEPTEEAPLQVKTLDFESIYALHDPDETVLTIAGQEIPWRDYFYFYYSEASQMDQQFELMQHYGYSMGWEDQADEEGHSYADLVPLYAEESLRQLITIENVAEENGVTLSEEEEAALQEQHQGNITRVCGEEATEEDFYEYLQGVYLRPELYWRMNRANLLYQNSYRQLYGENGELLTDEEALAYMEEQGLLSANHILIATVDLTTGEALAEGIVEEKTALAQQIAEELQEIEEDEARIARFLELKEQYCEDGGDYVFGSGVMVPEFEEGPRALENYQVSDPILTQYGYHIILRRPLDADAEVVTTSGSGLTGRSMAANVLFGERMQDYLESLPVEPVNGFQAPVLMDYYG